MHSIAPYLIRCFDPSIQEKNPDKKFLPLNSIKGHDLFDLISTFVSNNSSSVLKKIDSDKKAYLFTDQKIDPVTREISGIMQSGIFGLGSEILDIDTGSLAYKKTTRNADLFKYYFHFFIPKGVNEAICMLQTIRGDGIKTLFFNELSIFMSGKISLPLRVNPMPYDKAMEEWQQATTKEIKVVKFSGLKDQNDIYSKMGHLEAELILKPKKRGSSFGPFKDFFKQGTEQAEVVELLQEQGKQVKAIVQIGNKKRTFLVGDKDDNTLCSIELPDSIQLNGNGDPDLNEIGNWVVELINEYCVSLYPGIGRPA